MIGDRQSVMEAGVLRQLRQVLHQRLIASVEVTSLPSNDSQAVDKRLDGLLKHIVSETGVKLTEAEKRNLCDTVSNEVQGMGPLTVLMADAAITDIMVNGPSDIWVDRHGRLEKTELHFDDEAHLRRFVDRYIAAQGKHLDSTTPAVDARLPDGSRMHVVIPPLSPVGTVVSIRRFRDSHTSIDDLVSSGMLSLSMADLLACAVRSGVNVVIAGGAGAGKTTLLNALSEFIPDNERVVTIEESPELSLRHGHVISLEGRQGNSEGRGAVSLRMLLRNALRMRADRIVVGEVRGDEVFDMLQAMNVGHDGSMTTVHANNPQQVLKRLETLALLAGGGVAREAIRDMIESAVQLIVQVTRFGDGSRRVTSICEVQEGDAEVSIVELFKFQKNASTVVDSGGKSYEGKFVYCGVEPAFLSGVKASGGIIPDSLLSIERVNENG